MDAAPPPLLAPGASATERRAAARAIAADPLSGERAAQELIAGFLASSTASAERSKIDFLAELVDLASGAKLFPLTVAKLRVPLGALKVAHYRSADSYLAVARRAHLRLGHPLDEETWDCSCGCCAVSPKPFVQLTPEPRHGRRR